MLLIQKLVHESETSVFYFKYNQERLGEKTPLANVNIREAISKAFNKQDLVDVVISEWFCTSKLLSTKRLYF